jgi:tetratricopeptide (TPR) repeat protein
MPRFSAAIILILMFALSVPPVAATEDGETFTKAYQQYNQAVSAGDFVAASVHAQEALDRAGAAGRSAQEQATLAYNLGFVLHRAVPASEEDGALKLALEALEDALEAHEALYGKKGVELLPVLEEIGLATMMTWGGSVPDYFNRAIDILERQPDVNSARLAYMLRLSGQATLAAGRRGQAKKLLTKAIKIHEQAGTPDVTEYAMALFTLGKYHLYWKPKKSVDLLLRATDLFRTELPESHHLIMMGHSFLIQAYERTDEPDKATKHVQAMAALAPEGDVGEPAPLFRKMQEYPSDALRSGIEATIVMSFTITADGRVKDVVIIKADIGRGSKSSAPGLRQKFKKVAVATVSGYRYKPAVVNGAFVERPDQFISLSWRMAH